MIMNEKRHTRGVDAAMFTTRAQVEDSVTPKASVCVDGVDPEQAREVNALSDAADSPRRGRVVRGLGLGLLGVSALGMAAIQPVTTLLRSGRMPEFNGQVGLSLLVLLVVITFVVDLLGGAKDTSVSRVRRLIGSLLIAVGITSGVVVLALAVWTVVN